MLLEFAFSASLIDQIKTYLNTSSTELEGSAPSTVSGDSFGTTPASVACAGDAAKAQQKVKDAITDMTVGLQGYVDALIEMENRAYQVEDVTVVAINQHIATAEACQTPTIAQSGVCTPAGD